MSLPGILLCIAYGILSGVNLFFCAKENEVWRKRTKPFCLLLLLAFVLVMDVNAYFLWIALLLAWIGDVLFLGKQKKIFVGLGMLFFLASHAFYIAEIATLLPSYGAEGSFALWAFCMRFSPFLLVVSFPLSVWLARKDWKIASVGALYSAVLLCFISSSIFGLIEGLEAGFWMVFVGSILYFASDFFNAYTLYGKRFRYRELFIMSTYLVGQALIALGFLYTK